MEQIRCPENGFPTPAEATLQSGGQNRWRECVDPLGEKSRTSISTSSVIPGVGRPGGPIAPLQEDSYPGLPAVLAVPLLRPRPPLSASRAEASVPVALILLLRSSLPGSEGSVWILENSYGSPDTRKQNRKAPVREKCLCLGSF